MKSTMDSERAHNRTYAKGSDAGVKGPLYEIQVAQLFFLRSLAAGRRFRLAVNFDEPQGQKFDDVVFCNGDDQSYRMVQLKYNQHRQPVQRTDLTADFAGDFSLAKYFLSYLKIRERRLFGESWRLKDVVLFTNRHVGELAEEGVVAPIEGLDDVFDYGNSDRRPSKEAKFYRLNDDAVVKESLASVNESEMKSMAKTLLDWFLQSDDGIRWHQSPWTDNLQVLHQEILVLDGDLVRLRPFDRRSTNGTTERFREILTSSLRSRDANVSLADLRRASSLSKRVRRRLAEADDAGWSWDRRVVDDADLSDFRAHFVLAVDQPSLEEMNWVLRGELGRMLADLGPLRLVQQQAVLDRKMMQWYHDFGTGRSKTGSFLTEADAEVYVGRSGPFCSVGDSSDLYIVRELQLQVIPESVLGAITRRSEEKRTREPVEICWTTEEFDRLCATGRSSRDNIYLLKESGRGGALLVRTGGRIEPLRRLVEEIEKDASARQMQVKEDALADRRMTGKMVIVSDGAGTGKSTTLNRWSRLLKEVVQGSWVVRVDLSDCETRRSLQRLGRAASDDVVAEFGRHVLAYDDGQVGDFKRNAETVTVLLDGFDETPDDTQRDVADAVERLVSSEVRQIWIATRPHLQTTLEDRFGQFAVTFKPLTEEDQVDLVERFWRKHYVAGGQDAGALRSKAACLVGSLAASVRDKHKSFTAIALHCRLLAEAFGRRVAAQEPPAEGMTLIQLYDVFVESKWDLFRNKMAISDPWLMKHTRIGLTERIQRLALDAVGEHSLFNSSAAAAAEEHPGDALLAKLGLTTGPVGSPRFLHQSLAEYFTARYWTRKMQQHPGGWPDDQFHFFVDRLLGAERFAVVRSFVSDWIDGQRPLPSPQSVFPAIESYRAALNRTTFEDDERTAKFVIDLFQVMVQRLALDCCETAKMLLAHPLRNAALSRNEKLMRLLLTFAKQKQWSYAELAEDELNIFHSAATNTNEKVMECLLEFARKEQWNTEYFLKLNAMHNPITLAANNPNEQVMRLLLEWTTEKGLDCHKSLEVAFYHAAVDGNEQVLRCLLDFSTTNKWDIGPDFKYDCYAYVFHRAVKTNRNDRAVSLLLDFAKQHQWSSLQLLQPDYVGKSIFDYAAEKEEESIMRTLLDFARDQKWSSCELLGCGCWHRTLAAHAARNGDKELANSLRSLEIRRLLGGKMKNPFHYAAKNRNEQVLRMLLDFAREKQWDAVELLGHCYMEWAANFFNDAAENENEKIVAMLLEYAKEKEWNDIELLVPFDDVKRNPFHLAAMNGNEQIMVSLLEFADEKEWSHEFLWLDDLDYTPFHYAAENTSDKIIESLLDFARKKRWSHHQLAELVTSEEKMYSIAESNPNPQVLNLLRVFFHD